MSYITYYKQLAYLCPTIIIILDHPVFFSFDRKS